MIWRMFSRCTALAYGDVCPGLLGLRALAAMASDDTAGARVLQVRGASVAGAWVATDDGSGDRGPIPWRFFLPQTRNGHRLESWRDSKGREPVGRRRRLLRRRVPWSPMGLLHNSMPACWCPNPRTAPVSNHIGFPKGGALWPPEAFPLAQLRSGLDRRGTGAFGHETGPVP